VHLHFRLAAVLLVDLLLVTQDLPLSNTTWKSAYFYPYQQQKEEILPEVRLQYFQFITH
jgi:hypothetical protein